MRSDDNAEGKHRLLDPNPARVVHLPRHFPDQVQVFRWPHSQGSKPKTDLVGYQVCLTDDLVRYFIHIVINTHADLPG